MKQTDRGRAWQKSITDSVRNYWATVLLLVPSLCLLYPGAAEMLQYERSAIAAGQWIRMLAGHWTHWNIDHGFWDILMFAVLGAFCERQSRLGLLLATFGSAMAISAVLWCMGEVTIYRGLSGLDSALFAFAAAIVFQEAWKQRQWTYLGTGALFVSGFVAKFVFEILTGATLFVDAQEAQFVPVPLVHAIGAVIGLAAFVLTQTVPPIITAVVNLPHLVCCVRSPIDWFQVEATHRPEAIGFEGARPERLTGK